METPRTRSLPVRSRTVLYPVIMLSLSVSKNKVAPPVQQFLQG